MDWLDKQLEKAEQWANEVLATIDEKIKKEQEIKNIIG